MHSHWADQTHHPHPLTEADLRLLHDQGHNHHPEQNEPDATATSTPTNQENQP